MEDALFRNYRLLGPFFSGEFTKDSFFSPFIFFLAVWIFKIEKAKKRRASTFCDLIPPLLSCLYNSPWLTGHWGQVGNWNPSFAGVRWWWRWPESLFSPSSRFVPPALYFFPLLDWSWKGGKYSPEKSDRSVERWGSAGGGRPSLGPERPKWKGQHLPCAKGLKALLVTRTTNAAILFHSSLQSSAWNHTTLGVDPRSPPFLETSTRSSWQNPLVKSAPLVEWLELAGLPCFLQGSCSDLPLDPQLQTYRYGFRRSSCM